MADEPRQQPSGAPGFAEFLRKLKPQTKPTAAQRRHIRRIDHWHAHAAGDLARLGASRADLAALAAIAEGLRQRARSC
jgi:hypothetical protein